MDPTIPNIPQRRLSAEELANISTPDTHSPDCNSPSASASGPYNTNTLRSCIFCRQRKIKCDRQQPCSNCLRLELDCSYPAGRGRAKRRPPLVDRLQRLEDTIRRLASQVDAAKTTDGASPATEVGPRHGRGRGNPSVSNSNDTSLDASIDQQLGRLMIDDSKSYYVSNIMWANLGNEWALITDLIFLLQIEELRDLLHDPASDDEDYAPTDGYISEAPSPFGVSAAVLGFRSPGGSIRSYHPPMHMSVALLTIFSENVLPLLHIFHMPTTGQWYWDTIVSLDSLNKNTETLLFSIYYSAVISMDEAQCLAVLGSTRADSLDKYRFAVEQALARANLLNTQSFVLLQAAVLFLSGLRNEDDSRTTWSLTSLIFHIAQAMGLHRDGTTFGLKPLDTELRRRLWWHICLLDMRSSEFHGYEPIVHEGMFDTKLPLNINDSDISPLMTQAPLEHEGTTEMTFCLIRCEGMRAGWKVGYASPTPNATAECTLEDREAVVKDLKSRLETRYLRYCNDSVPFMLFTTTVARLIIARTWLVVHYPSKQKPDYSSTLSQATRDLLFSTSTEVIELSSFLLDSSTISKWTWHSKTHIQWHAVIFVLSEICSRPSSAECDRAWECVNTVHDRWNVKESGKRGNLWRPIKRLMVKARYVREMQQIDPTFCYSGPAAPIPSGTMSTPNIATGLQPGIFPSNLNSITGAIASDEYMDWMLGDLGIDMYGRMSGGFENLQ
ncbi:hypothetical protein FLONG3_1179 [Fusarium longipes]|uniref:Zn(2)-C6 fungal-type domain-containing protein n=1 Tax=Fusarium longipes TaxID=694270 RepID=A0A395T7H9_9HYPO|nr:hypothetical protein FLONG3_1179 [Fusarium longipes]